MIVDDCKLGWTGNPVGRIIRYPAGFWASIFEYPPENRTSGNFGNPAVSAAGSFWSTQARKKEKKICLFKTLLGCSFYEEVGTNEEK